MTIEELGDQCKDVFALLHPSPFPTYFPADFSSNPAKTTLRYSPTSFMAMTQQGGVGVSVGAYKFLSD